jgi:26S proteasome regulatory subunit N9
MAFMAKHADALRSAAAHQDAYVLAAMSLAQLRLASGDADGTLALMNECGGILDRAKETRAAVSAAYYRVSADYHKAKAAYPKYYHTALLYLSCVPLADLPPAERQGRAYELALAALLGEGLYNFGDLLAHPIAEALKAPPTTWLHRLLLACNAGDAAVFDAVTGSPEFTQVPLLSSAIAALRQKFCLMTLVQVVFARDRASRGRMTFAEVARETRVAPDAVEHLAMRALALGLIRGSIDQVEGVVRVTWVQPRVLDRAQMGVLVERLGEWATRVGEQARSLEGLEGASEVFVQ